MNRSIAPITSEIQTIETGFPLPQGNLYKIPSEEGVFRLDIIFPGAGYGIYPHKFHALYATELLLSGTDNLNVSQIAEEIDVLGGYVFKSCDYYNSSISLYGTVEHLNSLLKLVKSSVENCCFDGHELEVFKQKKLSELQINLNRTSFLANR